MTTANEVVWSLGSEDHLPSNSKINMEQIRSTMMQHEELFKEQVQTLHKLYNIQISAMQEIKKRIYTQAQVMAFGDSQMCGSVLDGKPLTNPQTNKEESLNLSLHPFCELKELMGVKSIHDARSKPMRDFDLERLPEDCIDESEILVASNSSKISNERLYATENKATDDSPQHYVPAVGYSLVGSNPKSRLDKSTSHQGLVSVDPGQNDLTRTAKQAKENMVPSSNQSNQNLDSKVSQLDDYINGISPSTSPAILSQGSSNQEDSKYHHGVIIQTSNSSERNSFSGNQNSHSSVFTSQTSLNGGNEFHGNELPNDSGNGSNSTVHSQSTKGFEDQNIDTNTKKNNAGFGDESPAVRSEPENIPEFAEDASLSNSELKEESNPKDNLALEHENESIAAEILLSFIDSKPHCLSTQVEFDSNTPSKVNAGVERKWNLRERRSMNHTHDIVNEPTKWTKLVRRRRTSRRAR